MFTIKKVSVAYRFSQDTVDKLEEICKIYEMSKTKFIELKIAQEYDALTGDPKIKKAIEAMKQCAVILNQVSAGEISSCPADLIEDGMKITGIKPD